MTKPMMGMKTMRRYTMSHRKRKRRLAISTIGNAKPTVERTGWEMGLI